MDVDLNVRLVSKMGEVRKFEMGLGERGSDDSDDEK